MNAFWRDRHRRELLIAAMTGAVWALVGVALASSTDQNPPAPSPRWGGLGRGEAVGTGFVNEHVNPCTRLITPPPQGEGNGEIHLKSQLTIQASCRIRNHLAGGATNIGSGTLVDVTANGQRGLVLTCAHLFTEGRGRVIVEFPTGRTHGANVIALDAEADLAALEIADPQLAPAPLSLAIESTSNLTACGYGPSGAYRCIAGRVLGAAESAGQASVQIAGAVRSGDSGGGVFDERGRLCAVVWGEAGGVTYASTGRPLQRFLQRVLGNRLPGRAGGVSPLPTQPHASVPIASNCPNGRCPLLPPQSLSPIAPYDQLDQGEQLGGAPAGRGPAASGDCSCSCNGDCEARFAALDARLGALASDKQDRGDFLTPGALAGFARTDEIAQLESHNRERHQSLVDRVDGLVGVVGSAGRAAAPLALPALGVSGPMGWAIIAGAGLAGTLAGRWMRRSTVRVARREARERNSADQLAPRASQLPPAQEAPAATDGSFRGETMHIETHAPIERDDREARELLRLSQLEGRDPLQDALAGRLALDRLDAAADGDVDPQHRRWADDLRRELRERFNEVAPTKFELKSA